jgi:hypothetical protein
MRRIFWGFCKNRFGIGPLHYVSSRSDFGFKFSEIFVIEKVHYIPGFLFATLIFYRAGLALLSTASR